MVQGSCFIGKYCHEPVLLTYLIRNNFKQHKLENVDFKSNQWKSLRH